MFPSEKEIKFFYIVILVVVGFAGWAIIEFLIWLFKHIHFSF